MNESGCNTKVLHPLFFIAFISGGINNLGYLENQIICFIWLQKFESFLSHKVAKV